MPSTRVALCAQSDSSPTHLILSGCCWGRYECEDQGQRLIFFLHVDEGLCVEHEFGNVLAELGDLFADADVAEEGTGKPDPMIMMV